MFKKYEEFIQYMDQRISRVYSLDNFKAYCDYKNNPQKKLNCIHIGGTNGKGSTTNYTKQILMENKLKVATFTSPALISRLDCIKVNDISINEDEILNYANQYYEEWLTWNLSIFEIEVYIAILFFIDQKVDWAIYEVGLGGKLDATNIISPKLCVNTNISIDHVDYLGHSLESIAQNKAGIVKKNIPYITGETNQDVINVFQKKCDELNSPLYFVQEINNINDRNEYEYRNLKIKLNTSATYQIKNSALAFEIIYIGNQMNLFKISNEEIQKGLYEAHWPGRFETICQNPLIIIDGAHNQAGIEAFVNSAKKYQDSHIIFSALIDKNSDAMIESLLSLSSDITVCHFEHPRFEGVDNIVKDFPIKSNLNYQNAIDEAIENHPVILITGSLYFISLVRAYILSKREETTL